MGGWAEVEDGVNDCSNGSTNEWTQPVDPVVSPCPAHHSRSEGDCWVHGCTVEGTACQDVGTHNETNCNGCNDPDVSLLGVDGGGVYSVNQPKGHYNLENNRIPSTHAGGQGES